MTTMIGALGGSMLNDLNLRDYINQCRAVR